MDTITTPTTTPIPARKVRALKAPRAGTLTARIVALLARAHAEGEASGWPGTLSSRALINAIIASGGPTVSLRTMSATLAILRARGTVQSVPMLNAEHGQLAYGLTERGLKMAALLPVAAEGAPNA